MIVFLTGFMGSGKSRIGRELSQKKGWNFIDTDREIEDQVHMSVKDIFAEKGESYFRQLEEEMIKNITEMKTDCVVALGGGALISENSLTRVLDKGWLVYIKSDAESIYQRVQHTTKRPLLQEDGANWDKEIFLEKIKKLLIIRETGYARAHLIIQRDKLEAPEVADQIILFLDRQR